MIEDYLKLALANMKHRNLRSWLTILGIVIGVAAVVSFLTLNESIIKGIEDEFERFGVNDIRLTPGELQSAPNANRALNAEIANDAAKISTVDYIEPITIDSGQVIFRSEERLLTVIGTQAPPKNREDRTSIFAEIADGRELREQDKGVVILGNNVATEVFDRNVSVGDTLTIEKESFEVIGIFTKTDSQVDDQVYIQLSEAETMFNHQDSYNVVVLRLRKGVDIEAEAVRIEKQLLRKYEDSEFDVFTVATILEEIEGFFSVINIVLSGIAGISVIVAAVGIMNSMFTSVLERTSQIGVIKAIGATNQGILTIFLIEAGIIGLVGGIIGVVVGIVMAYGLVSIVALFGFLPVTLSINFGIIAWALLFSICIGLVSGIAPAIRAAKMNVVEALRYE